MLNDGIEPEKRKRSFWKARAKKGKVQGVPGISGSIGKLRNHVQPTACCAIVLDE